MQTTQDLWFVPSGNLHFDWTVFAQSIFFFFLLQKHFEKSVIEKVIHLTYVYYTHYCMSSASSQSLLMCYGCESKAGLNKLYLVHTKSKGVSPTDYSSINHAALSYHLAGQAA